MVNRKDRPHLLEALKCLKFYDVKVAESEGRKLTYLLMRGIKVQNLTFQDITDPGLAHLIGGCRYLTSTSLYRCWQITDVGLVHLARGCRKLTSIDLTDCWQITNTGLISLVDQCRGLT